MKVFMSWSGSLSRRAAEILRDWLPNVLQAIEPWMSTDDIEKGTRWSLDVATELSKAKVGILCVTSDNLDSPWLYFEAGALSRAMDKTFVCPIPDLVSTETETHRYLPAVEPTVLDTRPADFWNRGVSGFASLRLLQRAITESPCRFIWK